ncbi:MAG: GWxTD domain-containing protein, partial [FCB group bacterium]|nr:GWxTD domain-containing protein [FCB group bacterium]
QQMVYILDDKERRKLKGADGQKREALFKEFWKARDPNPDTEQNELMDEYYRRIKYSNDHFSGFSAGWMTDMGMIYVLFGPPDEVERSASTQSQRNYELWYYHRINRQFLFIDYNGFGDYRLDVPLVGDPFRGL